MPQEGEGNEKPCKARPNDAAFSYEGRRIPRECTSEDGLQKTHFKSDRLRSESDSDSESDYVVASAVMISGDMKVCTQ